MGSRFWVSNSEEERPKVGLYVEAEVKPAVASHKI